MDITRGIEPKEEILKRKGRNRSFAANEMETALNHLRDGKSIREAARLANIPYATVRRYWLRLNNKQIPMPLQDVKPIAFTLTPSPTKLKSILKKPVVRNVMNIPLLNPYNRESLKLFNEKQEITLATLFNGKNGNECRRIACEMAIEWNIQINSTWMNEGMADKEWMTNFRKRLPDLLEKQYRNNQKDLFEDSLSKNSNDSSSKTSNNFSSNKTSQSNQIDSFVIDSSSSNSDMNIVKMERSESENNNKRPTNFWDKRLSTIFSDNMNYTNRNKSRSDDSITLISPEKNNDKSETRSDELRAGSSRSNYNHRQIHRKDDENHTDENPSTALHINNDDYDEDDNDSEETLYSSKSKKSKSNDVQIGRSDFVKMVKGMSAVNKQNMDADELFLLSLLPALKRIAEKDKLKVKIKLLEVFNQFEE